MKGPSPSGEGSYFMGHPLSASDILGWTQTSFNFFIKDTF